MSFDEIGRFLWVVFIIVICNLLVAKRQYANELYNLLAAILLYTRVVRWRQNQSLTY